METNEIIQSRLQKLNQIKELGINPYPNRFNKEKTISQVLSLFEENEIDNDQNEKITIATAGRILSSRPMGKAAFYHIRDLTGTIQVYANDKTLNEKDYSVFKRADIGDIIGITGELFITKKGEESIRATGFTMLAKNIEPLPVVKEKDGKTYDAFSDVESRYRKRYIDFLVNPDVRDDFIIRSKIIRTIRDHLHKKGFIEVETPMMQAVASGAAARPFITHHNTLDMDLYLRIAPELYLKRMIVGGFEKIFELNRNFRNEGISTKHNPEFTMMEVYQAYADYEDMMKLTEDIFSEIANSIYGTLKIPFQDNMIDLSTPWQRVEYLEIIKEKSNIDFQELMQEEDNFEKAKIAAVNNGLNVDHCKTFWEIVDEVFSQKVEPELIQPVFITHFPKDISPLSKDDPERPGFVERFEPYITGKEMGNAFSELNDPEEQEKRFQVQLEMKEAGQEETMELDEDFIAALKTGMPPTGGLGIGIDRLVMLFTNKSSIKDVIAFPLLKKKEQ